MSLFGKVLAVLNLTALCAFFYLAVVDFQARQAWAYRVFRWELALDGFPVDGEEPDGRNRLRLLNLHPSDCAELVGSADTRTLEQFLEQRKDQILAKVDSEKIKGTPTEKLAEVLMQLAETPGERDKLQALKRDTSPTMPEKLKVQLEERIAALKKAPAGADKKDRDGKKLAIARALFNLVDALPTEDERKARLADRAKPPEQRADPSADQTYQQTFNALGLRLMLRALDIQAQEMAAMTSIVADQRQQERMLFTYQHQQIINQLIDREHLLQEQKDLLVTKNAQAEKQKVRANEQKVLADERKKDWEALQAVTAKELDRLEAEQDRLFKLRLRLRDANRINQEMEEQIRKLEAEKQ